ncbi:TetR/AcrR family transcriptional regulator [Kitasatospora sp. A2-31]|uniref:TetR/AcrR family transcriptional regulator n=1 Tax=Kitasatospora sp. A2-31 TaxID=2916414 RepID=UPI001EEA7444|nr:TetR/AcrR family transcriptional regulator [Kitasatospora sp. A2-31]MCG6495468.1 TetR/AcrR family transcriptional regulator [Kitasatospora sp. A2-31]MCG6500332.1 TetR/AcrR family transcriptional regulator [Kitasatospora sp. A2-31]
MARADSAAPSGGRAGVDPEALWSVSERPRRGRPPAHSRAEITATAVAIADAEGLAAVTMRAVAARLGAGTMSLYSYVPNKETLLELMIDEVSGDHRLPAMPTGDWRSDLRRIAHEQRAIMRRHPWLPAALPARQTLGPNTLAVLDHVLAVMIPTGLDAQARLETFSLLTGFVASHMSYELAQQRAVEAAGRSPGELLDAQARYLRAAVADGRYPHLAQALAIPGGDQNPQAVFDRLLDRVINGIAPDPA